MNPKVWCQTDVGLRRETNQDFFLFDEEVGLYIVADGMGGHRGGEVASRMASETMLEVIKSYIAGSDNRRISPRVLLSRGYEKASQKVYETSQASHGELEGMGTTMVAAYVQNGSMYIGNVGDSRCYLYTNGQLFQLTEDHSLMNEQLRVGLITEENIANFVGKNVITRSVGFEPAVEVDIIERDLVPGDLYIICSDGLCGQVLDNRLAEICATHKPHEIVPICVAEANANGGDDNVTVMVLYAQGQSN